MPKSMSQPKLSVETQTSIYNCLCMPVLDCFRSTKHGMYKKPCPTTPAMVLCEFHHPPISLYIIKNTNLSFKPTLSNNRVQSILFSEAQLETLSFFSQIYSHPWIQTILLFQRHLVLSLSPMKSIPYPSLSPPHRQNESTKMQMWSYCSLT